MDVYAEWFVRWGRRALLGFAYAGLAACTAAFNLPESPTLEAPDDRLFSATGDRPVVSGVRSEFSFRVNALNAKTLPSLVCRYDTPYLANTDPDYADGVPCLQLAGLDVDLTNQVIAWTPAADVRGVYRFVLHLENADSVLTSPVSFSVAVRDSFAAANLLAAFDPALSLGYGATPLGPRLAHVDTREWPSLASEDVGNLSAAGFSSPWVGTGGATNPYGLSFGAVESDRVDFGSLMAGQPEVRLEAWVKPAATAERGSVLLSNGGGSGTGLVVRQSRKTASKLELRVGPDYEGKVLAYNPIGYWRLGESSGVFKNFGSAGSAADGHLTGAGATRNQSGILASDADGSLRFSGSGSTYVTTGNSAAFDFEPDEDYTLLAWARATVGGNGGRILATGHECWSEGYTFELFGSPPHLVAGLGNTGGHPGCGGGGPSPFFATSAQLTEGTWYFLAAVVRGSQKKSQLYINGAVQNLYSVYGSCGNFSTPGVVDYAACAATDPASGVAPFLGRGVGGVAPLYGNIDEVAIIPQALDPSEVLALYTAAMDPTICESASTWTSGAWHQVATRFDGTTARLYLDGNSECAQTFAPADVIASTHLIAGAESTGRWPWSGVLGHLLVYSQGTSALIQENFAILRGRFGR